ncbi:hypothetical protein [Burkholderia ambifaria]|uniref:hypothetical protein n=1 Tax=Burkholderia ambifaria TaxID=152480 RepID=UPI001C931E09|nr:hypothetical protein [Burkholderia ambifaria]MBY4768947.1 hypothetical protein [Burkholderia ambifaria]
MMKSKKEMISRAARIIELIKLQPGITSAEIAKKLNLEHSTKASTAIWPSVKAGRVLVERIVRNGTTMNAHYMSDDVPPDAVERIQQKIVDAKNVIPIAKSSDVRTSVFDNKQQSVSRPRPAKRSSPTSLAIVASPETASKVGVASFSCAVTNDGSLVLIREGQIQFSLTNDEATKLQSYLVKRAAANFFASMA